MKLRKGQAVTIVDYFRAMNTCRNRDLGDGVLYGAGGQRLPEGALQRPAVVVDLGTRGSGRVLIQWPAEDAAMWIDSDNLAAA